MRKVKFCFLAIVIVCLLASLSYAQSNTITTTKDRGIAAKQLKNTPLKPVQSQPGVEINIPTDIGLIMFTKLSVGPDGSGTNGRRLCPITIRNTSAQSIAYGQYFLKYWSRASSSEPWKQYYGSTLQWPIPAHQTKTFDLHISIPSGATEFRVTLSNDVQTPVICEISAPVM